MSDKSTISIEEMSTTERLGRALEELVKIDRGLLSARDLGFQEAMEAVRNVKRDIEVCREYSGRDCVHCGSPLTFRRSDGDVGCKDCTGIMPENDEVAD